MTADYRRYHVAPLPTNGIRLSCTDCPADREPVREWPREYPSLAALMHAASIHEELAHT